jgi:hypothetical protein
MAGNQPGDVQIDKDTVVEDILASNDPSMKRFATQFIENSGFANRPWWVNLFLVFLLVGGAAMILVFYIEFWVIDQNLTGDPSPVWAQTLWLWPNLVVVVLSLQTLVMGVKTGYLQAPAVWMVVHAFVAFVFNCVVLVFYQRLFWQCVTNTGNLETLEDDICNDHLAELSTIAWCNVLFVVHSLTAIGIGVLVMSFDFERFEELRAQVVSGAGSAAGSIARKLRRSEASIGSHQSVRLAGAASKDMRHRRNGAVAGRGWV